MTNKNQDRIDATAKLQELCPEGTTVYCIIRSVSRSGMSRRIDCYVVNSGELIWISGYMAYAMGLSLGKNHDGLRVGGCGMNMCFALVYDLARTLHKDGYKLKHCTM
jgi:hypothetical protein